MHTDDSGTGDSRRTGRTPDGDTGHLSGTGDAGDPGDGGTDTADAARGATDEQLLARARHDPPVFEQVVTRHATALYGYFARRAPGAADDLLSELWLRALAGRATFDGRRGSARAWLFGVARNVLSAYWRQRSQEAPEWALLDTGADHDPWQAVDHRLDAAAVAPALRRALRELTDEERELLLLVAWEQLTPAEAAAVVGIRPGTARSRLHRARTKLRDHLRSDPAGPLLSTTVSGEFA